MAAEVEVLGLQRVNALGRLLQAEGNEGLRRELVKEFRGVGTPIKDDARASASSVLPHRGGLAAIVAGGRFSVATRLTGKAGVALKVSASVGSVNVKGLDAGSVSHPVFGHGPSVRQSIVPGWFSGPTKNSAPLARVAVGRAAATVAARVEGF